MDAVLRSLGFFLLAAFGLLALVSPAWPLDDREGVLVGRIAFIEGDVLRYVPEEKDWTLTVVDAPFGLEDTLYAGDNARAEIIMPNGVLMRIGEQTQVQVIDLLADAATLDVASGQARFSNNSESGMIKTTTPFGSVVASAGSAFDLYVGDESLEVIAVRGEIEFIHDASGQRYPIMEGGNSLIADQQTVTSGNGTVDGDWHDWNSQRESLWAQRRQTPGTSLALLPAPIREEGYVLEENGRWERVYYDGAYRDMWRPTRITSGWQPFTVGRWVNYYGDNCWMPNEPFGYLTHHYGSWIYVDAFRSWYWLPPVTRRHVASPALRLGFGWYPGRVGWFSRGSEIGWVPLAPNEDYYGSRSWGHRTKVIRHSVPLINLARFRYLGHACLVDRDRLYRQHRSPDSIRRDLRGQEQLHQFRPITTWDAFKGDRRRFDFSDREARRKPHALTFERIQYNQKRLQPGERFDRKRIEQDLRRFKTGHELRPREDRHTPFVSHKMVDADKMDHPIDRSSLPKKAIKPQERERHPFRDTQSGFDRDIGKQPQQRLAPAGDRQGRPLPPQAGKEPDQHMIRRLPDEPREMRPPRQPDRPHGREGLNQDPRRPALDGRWPRHDQVRDKQQQRQGNELQPRQVEDRQQRRLESEQQQQQHRQMEQRQREEAKARQQRLIQERRDRQETLRRQQQNEEHERQRALRRQQEQQQQQELRRRQQADQQRREEIERRRQQQELKQLKHHQQEQEAQRRQQRESRQRQIEDQARQKREEQQRIKQQPSRERQESRDNQQKRRQRSPFEEAQGNQPMDRPWMK